MPLFRLSDDVYVEINKIKLYNGKHKMTCYSTRLEERKIKIVVSIFYLLERESNMGYNDLPSDIRLTKTSKEDAIKVIKQFEEKWIYVKLIEDKIFEGSLQNYVVNYNKFKVANINEDSLSNLLFIYGNEDEDRLIFSTDEIIQTEKSCAEDEVLIVLNNVNMMTEVYIKTFVPNKERLIHDILNTNQNLIITEGKTDWKHLKAALKKLNSEGLYNDLDFKFLEYEGSLTDNHGSLLDKNLSGCDTLNSVCQYNSLFYNEKLRIFVFDSDIEKLNKLYKNEQGFTYLGNNVYAVILPLPEFRKETPEISIENYYTDDEIKTEDENGKRLYLSHELSFNMDVRRKNSNKYYSLKARDNMPNLIIDQDVYENDQNLEISNNVELKEFIKAGKLTIIHPLSKNKFAENILNEVPPFNTFSKENFKLFFNVIEKIFALKDQNKQNSVLKLIEHKEIQEGICIEYYQDHQEFHLDIAFPNEIIKELRSSSIVMNSIFTEKNQIIITSGISLEKERLLCRMDITVDLLKFIQNKAENANNRVYLNIHSEENNGYVCSFELFKNDSGYFAFEHLSKQLWHKEID